MSTSCLRTIMSMGKGGQRETQLGCFSSLLRHFSSSRITSSSSSLTEEIGNVSGNTNFQTRNSDKSHPPECHCISSCDFSYNLESTSWKDCPPPYSQQSKGSLGLEVSRTIDETLDKLSHQLRNLSLQIHDHPEMAFEEKFAHDILTQFMEDNGFKVTRSYLGLDTAWKAEFVQGDYRRVIGINSEMDALPSGHACGHNLIAIGGVGVALAVQAAFKTHNVPGKVILLGTPAEEGGGGKVILLDRGAYKEMDVCLMLHPTVGPIDTANIGSSTAMQEVEVEYFGKNAHAAASPWEGTNSLDAAFVAYSAISALRQQMPPTHRVHGIVQGKDWVQNVIPDYAKLIYGVRAPTAEERDKFMERVKSCLEAGALATSCEMKLVYKMAYDDLRPNSVLADAFTDIMGSRYGYGIVMRGTPASTDFGNVSYELPSLHPGYAISNNLSGANHTPEFVKKAATLEAHEATITVTKGLAAVAVKFAQDDGFAKKVKASFELRQKSLT